jgi:hypothetical protein
MPGPVGLRFRPEQPHEPVATEAGRRGRDQRQESETLALAGPARYRGTRGLERHSAEKPERGMGGR